MRKKYFFPSLKSMKKGVGISQKYGSWDPDPDPQQNVTDPQHWVKLKIVLYIPGN
jgi:hypothetical protein